MRVTQCHCGPNYYVRIPRAWWMRIFMGRWLHYGCQGCGASLFIRPVDNDWDPEATMKPRESGTLVQGKR